MGWDENDGGGGEMNCTNHAGERYCQRVMGMTEDEAKTALWEDKPGIFQKVLDMYEDAYLFWTGKANGHNADANYYFHSDGYIFIVEKDAIVTMYAADFGIDKEIDRATARKLYDKIFDLSGNRTRDLPAHEKKVQEINYQIDNAEITVEQIKAQLDEAKSKVDKLKAERTHLTQEWNLREKEVEVLAVKLINSMQYKLEMLAAAKGKKVG